MPSMFNARDADNYERLMGRWSRRLAPLFIEHAGIADGENVIEVGCGTGSLTFTFPQKAALGRLTAVDHSEIYLAAAKAKNKDARISLEQGDGCALRFPDASFDRALSMLVLPSVLPEPELMVAEMRRVTRPGGVVAAAFWDSPGGSPSQRMVWDSAAALDEAAAEARDRTMGRPIYAPGALGRMWIEAGLVDIDRRSLMIRIDFCRLLAAIRERRGCSRRLCCHPWSRRAGPSRAASARGLSNWASRWGPLVCGGRAIVLRCRLERLRTE